jgi:hypothetical protein
MNKRARELILYGYFPTKLIARHLFCQAKQYCVQRNLRPHLGKTKHKVPLIFTVLLHHSLAALILTSLHINSIPLCKPSTETDIHIVNSKGKIILKSKVNWSWALVAHTWNVVCLGERASVWLQDLKKPITKKDWWIGSRCRPWVQTLVPQIK